MSGQRHQKYVIRVKGASSSFSYSPSHGSTYRRPAHPIQPSDRRRPPLLLLYPPRGYLCLLSSLRQTLRQREARGEEEEAPFSSPLPPPLSFDETGSRRVGKEGNNNRTEGIKDTTASRGKRRWRENEATATQEGGLPPCFRVAAQATASVAKPATYPPSPHNKTATMANKVERGGEKSARGLFPPSLPPPLPLLGAEGEES